MFPLTIILLRCSQTKYNFGLARSFFFPLTAPLGWHKLTLGKIKKQFRRKKKKETFHNFEIWSETETVGAGTEKPNLPLDKQTNASSRKATN